MASDGAHDHDAALLRASDAERGAVLDRLQAAYAEGRITPEELNERSTAVHAARTRADLVPLTDDLPATEGAMPPAVTAAGLDRPATASPIVAVFGGTERRGRWRPARQETALAVFGGVELDLRDADLPAGELILRAGALFGGVAISVPDGMHVEATGFALFGGRAIKIRSRTPAAGTPVLRLHAWAIFGGVEVRDDPSRDH